MAVGALRRDDIFREHPCRLRGVFRLEHFPIKRNRELL
jgi:hypothetical protein